MRMAAATTRLEIRLEQPNPLFVKWLERWLQEAEARNSKSQYKLRTALQALLSYPLPLYSGRECAILRGFGSTLCALIDAELLQLRGNVYSGESMPAPALLARNNESYLKEVQQVVKKVQQQQQQQSAKFKTSETQAKLRKTTSEKPVRITKKAQRAMELEQQRLREVILNPGTFQIELLVDTQETSGKNKRILDQTRSYLETLTVPHTVRRLTVGDFLWIARQRNEAIDGDELVLPYIVERKRMDDLASSIRDGRFHEQKHRLRQCGIQHIIYLIEDYGNNEHLGLPLESLRQAMANTQIQNGFTVIHTENHYRSMVYLQCMTRTLIRQYKDKQLVSMSKEQLLPIEPHDVTVGLLKFRALYDDSARSAQLTVREVFVQQLLQLHSLSLERALALVELYPTPRALLDAYRACTNDTEARSLLAGICCGKLQRPLGLKISQCLYDFYCTEFN